MDTRTGEIASLNGFKKRLSPAEIGQFIKPIELDNLSEKTRDLLTKTGKAQISRNSKCPCGSNKRFKRCCMVKV